ncbi:fimbria/pilus periplasmic chaperone [Serratia ficaria]|uniref:fimbria/pilus periplasmic chaperone n=1 Tax=Serratia ficaria TaxID=61651 RepID=UPI002177BF9B|nr:fimbria/pilus periplasmic chaperone [Serratia ficaria]CAI1507940.1 Chaperone protein fimC precursor [Serratia ficaria]
MKHFSQKIIATVLLGLSALCCGPAAAAGGISLSGSRVVFPADAQQSTLSVKNGTASSTYLMQSWVEKADGTKTSDFVVTPPLYTSAPGNENTLRIISAGVPHPRDRESLYYMNVKAIPSVNRQAMEKAHGGLVVATVMRIKLFVRPAGLSPAREKAADALEFTRRGGKLDIRNPTPYYLTLTDLRAGGKTLENVMVPPLGSASVALPAGNGGTVTWNAINDYGGTDPGRSTLR